MIYDGDDVDFCMDFYPSIIFGHWVKFGPYLGEATRMVCERTFSCRATGVVAMAVSDPFV
ncbi:hypothetical protein Hanom_Chr05g00402181 [Helianthus anomalus]